MLNKVLVTFNDYRSIYVCCPTAPRLDLDKLTHLMESYSFAEGEDLKNLRRNILIRECLCQVKLLGTYIEEINLNKKLSHFDKTLLQSYLTSIDEIGNVLNRVIPDMDILELLNRGCL